MTDDKINLIISSDKEWRSHILKKLDRLEEHQIKQEIMMNVLKVKVTFFSAALGAIFGLASGFIKTHI